MAYLTVVTKLKMSVFNITNTLKTIYIYTILLAELVFINRGCDYTVQPFLCVGNYELLEYICLIITLT